MKPKSYLWLTAIPPLMFGLLSCRDVHGRASIDVKLFNNTTNEIEWSEVFFGKRRINFGVFGAGGRATYLDYQGPITERLIVRLTDAGKRIREYDVSLAGIYPANASGTLTLEIVPKGIVPRFEQKKPESYKE